ncbi:hypothetical protein M427DRAFT_50162 [Gonapodya prolifera JEL478]|uniref:Uncharacterized protein n=1 Tax=Gonapodya prolifera (strain JEL478) TaxID=1344416 RepID=A0A138ZWT7_GONPJ|nr:hypothetical protein M427DRAFT_50162 [Gonapodya prolifera JEL478]|eukprot:KXS08948.1 hypothetical protein M427DRAFT_50162 [Gonapodya prolifera JEL478]
MINLSYNEKQKAVSEIFDQQYSARSIQIDGYSKEYDECDRGSNLLNKPHAGVESIQRNAYQQRELNQNAVDPTSYLPIQLEAPTLKNQPIDIPSSVPPGYSRLTGLPDDMKHNNMNPFYKGSEPPVMNLGGLESDGYETVRDVVENKIEEGSGDRMLQQGVIRDICRAEDTITTSDQYVLPYPEIKVGVPADVQRSRILPKNVDDLRVLCRQKLIIPGRANQGMREAIGFTRSKIPLKPRRKATYLYQRTSEGIPKAGTTGERLDALDSAPKLKIKSDYFVNRMNGAAAAPAARGGTRDEVYVKSRDNTLPIKHRLGGPGSSRNEVGALRAIVQVPRSGNKKAMEFKGVAGPVVSRVASQMDRESIFSKKMRQDRNVTDYKGTVSGITSKSTTRDGVITNLKREDMLENRYSAIGTSTIKESEAIQGSFVTQPMYDQSDIINDTDKTIPIDDQVRGVKAVVPAERGEIGALLKKPILNELAGRPSIAHGPSHLPDYDSEQTKQARERPDAARARGMLIGNERGASEPSGPTMGKVTKIKERPTKFYVPAARAATADGSPMMSKSCGREVNRGMNIDRMKMDDLAEFVSPVQLSMITGPMRFDGSSANTTDSLRGRLNVRESVIQKHYTTVGSATNVALHANAIWNGTERRENLHKLRFSRIHISKALSL